MTLRAPPSEFRIDGLVAIGAMSYDGTSIGGLNRYTGDVIRALLPRLDRCVLYSNAPLSIDPERATVIRCPVAPTERSDFVGNAARLLWHQTLLPRSLRRLGTRAFYSPVPEGMLAPPCPQVITVHDLLPLRFPEVYPRLRHYFAVVLPRLLRASAAAIVDSDATRRDVVRFFGETGTPTHVINPGYRSDVFRPLPPDACAPAAAEFGLSNYMLAVGETRPYKNIRRLIEAFAAASVPGLQLAVVGAFSRLDPEIRELPRLKGIEGSVRFLGTVADETLAALYSGAIAFAFPSLYEGFGIPPLEAMACGTPVMASNASSIPEVCGDAALYFDPLDAAAIARAIREIAGNQELRARLRQDGLTRAASFSHEATADQIAGLLATVTLEPNPRCRKR